MTYANANLLITEIVEIFAKLINLLYLSFLVTLLI